MRNGDKWPPTEQQMKVEGISVALFDPRVVNSLTKCGADGKKCGVRPLNITCSFSSISIYPMAGPDQSQHVLAVLFGGNRRRRLYLFVLAAFSLSSLLVFLSVPGIDQPRPSISIKNETLVPPAETEPVVFSLIMWSEDAAVEGALLLKVDLHLIPQILFI